MIHELPLSKLCEVAIEAATEAGQFVKNAASENIERQFKNAGNSDASQLVTEIDIRSEAIIRERLKTVSEEFDIAFVGEESSSPNPGLVSERLRAACFWCVDPLDGTLPFVEGKSGYAVSIALVAQSGSPLIGVVYDPVDSIVIHAIKSEGAYRDFAPFSRRPKNSRSLVVYADASFKRHEKFERVIDALHTCAKSLELKDLQIEYGSGAVKNACQVLDHSSACYVKLPKAEDGGGSIWDYAATACIARESGGWASNIFGEPLDLNRSDSTFMNHQGIIYASNEKLARYLIDAL
ncbi:MAG: 3'(2'),5'-bisphosphate nucleotidase CysQ [Pseudomonadales bacterium]